VTVVVPDVVNKTTAAAVAILSAAGLAHDVKIVVAPPHPPGIVYDQAPNAGVTVAAGSTIKVWVPIGPGPTVAVPNLVGATQAQALVALNGVGLGSNVVLVPTNLHPAGKVFWQLPVAATNVAAGAIVQIRVAQAVGPALVTVPNVFGMTQAQATAALAAKGLATNATQVPTFGHPFLRVYDQAPNAGLVAATGSTVLIKIAVPIAVATVPNVIGLTPLQAKNAIQGAGYVSSGSSVPMIFKPHGKVYSQNPAGGAALAPGGVVHWKWNP
jgi:serine/threonine-protein kinase